MDKRKLAFIFSLFCFTLFTLFILQRPDGRLHLIFCDVGQGDAILVTTPSADQFLIDGGPDRKVLDCLNRFMPFWDRKIELVMLSHPQSDHFAGLSEVLKRYHVERMVDTGVENKTADFEAFVLVKSQEAAQFYEVRGGDRIDLGRETEVKILWPEEPLPTALNNTSIIFKLSWQDFCAILTGDGEDEALDQVEDPIACQVLKVPHHGSKNGLDKKFLNRVSPKMAVISVGKNNRYGHPHQEILEMLERSGVNIRRTDQNGAIEIVASPKGWYTK